MVISVTYGSHVNVWSFFFLRTAPTLTLTQRVNPCLKHENENPLVNFKHTLKLHLLSCGAQWQKGRLISGTQYIGGEENLISNIPYVNFGGLVIPVLPWSQVF